MSDPWVLRPFFSLIVGAGEKVEDLKSTADTDTQVLLGVRNKVVEVQRRLKIEQVGCINSFEL